MENLFGLPVSPPVARRLDKGPNTNIPVSLQHPMHLHVRPLFVTSYSSSNESTLCLGTRIDFLQGHDFLILGRSPALDNPFGVAPRRFDPATDTALLDFTNPARRDTTMLPGNGWVAVAFRSGIYPPNYI